MSGLKTPRSVFATVTYPFTIEKTRLGTSPLMSTRRLAMGANGSSIISLSPEG